MRWEVQTTLLAACASSLIACAADESTGSTTQSVTGWNKLASNKLASNKLASNKLASNKLASNKLASNKLASNMLSSQDLLSTADGRTVYSYIVSCALPAGMTIEAHVAGATSTAGDPFSCVNDVCDFPGVLGLTPDWLDKKLNRAGKGWISACMFARVNAHDTAEEISLHGENAALTVAIDEAALYTVEEGAFYGNMFTSDKEPIDWNACRGEGQASGEFGGLVDRDCAEPDPARPGLTQCGFKYAGDCADYTPLYPSPYACDERESGDPTSGDDEHGHHDHDGDHDRDHHNGGTTPPADHGFYYEGCHGAGGHGHEHGDDDDSHGYEQVVTTFVTP